LLAIVGGVIGSVFLLIAIGIIVLVLIVLKRRRRRKQATRKQQKEVKNALSESEEQREEKQYTAINFNQQDSNSDALNQSSSTNLLI
jgi:flagellar biosynthesis/type III secretory pathway M-ring protein FliF/YscJ